MSTNAKLNNALNSNKASTGQMVTARLTMNTKAVNGVKLPRGTKLIGKVAKVEHGMGSNPTRVTLRFNKARLPSGKTIPVKATLLGAMPPASGFYSAAADVFPTTSNPVPADRQVIQKPGVLHHISMQSSAKSNNSGTFISKKKNITLPAGTQLRLAIAPEQNATGVRG